jgi:hypothetical protein
LSAGPTQVGGARPCSRGLNPPGSGQAASTRSGARCCVAWAQQHHRPLAAARQPNRRPQNTPAGDRFDVLGWTKPHQQGAPPALGVWASWLGGALGWAAGGWWWGRRDITRDELDAMKWRELRNGRLAMWAGGAQGLRGRPDRAFSPRGLRGSTHPPSNSMRAPGPSLPALPPRRARVTGLPLLAAQPPGPRSLRPPPPNPKAVVCWRVRGRARDRQGPSRCSATGAGGLRDPGPRVCGCPARRRSRKLEACPGLSVTAAWRCAVNPRTRSDVKAPTSMLRAAGALVGSQEKRWRQSRGRGCGACVPSGGRRRRTHPSSPISCISRAICTYAFGGVFCRRIAGKIASDGAMTGPTLHLRFCRLHLRGQQTAYTIANHSGLTDFVGRVFEDLVPVRRPPAP